jgi:glycosyltransferase involved in cell wall biosynthesis
MQCAAGSLASSTAAGHTSDDVRRASNTPSRLAFIGNSLPRRCGIATFTTDLQQAVSKSCADVHTCIVAMTDHGHRYDYPPAVRLQLNDAKRDEYVRAAELLNEEQFDLVCLQHEFGIFGGEAGHYIMALLERLTMPIVTTLHTILAEPKPLQREVMNAIVGASSKVIVMAEKGRRLLSGVYGAPAGKIELIPHGIPDSAFVEPDAAKARRGFGGQAVILTFGLLSPNKGIEVMIDAMPGILKSRADAVYVVLGATHPNLVRQQGEGYRESLIARARSLGVEEHVVFLNRFVDQPTLLDFISMCDVYVSPYLNEAQMTSGTLAYSFGLGKAVVSTPYWHAQELLADGRGVLVPFGDVNAIGAEIAGLLTDDARREAMRQHAYSSSRSMIWARTAERYVAVFEGAKRAPPLKVIVREARSATLPDGPRAPLVSLGHLLSMCDDTGLFQHAVLSVPDRLHGYCVDDNARGLLVACALNVPGEQPLPEALTGRLAAFVQHAWNPDSGRFRNFMSFDRRWLENVGSQDSHGRTLWALGECARSDVSPSRRSWALSLFAQALPAVERFDSPRAWAFTLLGLDAYCSAARKDCRASELRQVLAERLMSLLSAVQTKEWVWFEDGLAYDNARLPQALIATGVATGKLRYVEAGLRSLRWLIALQTSGDGLFRPVGSASFGDKRQPPRAFDQQPLETTASISACLAAWRADGDAQWKTEATRAFAWFLGSNDLSLPLVDLETGSCRDGLHPDRRNENRGGESAVSYLLSVAEIRQLARTVGTDRSIHTLPLGRAGAPAEDNDSGTLGPARNEALWSAHGYPLKMSKGSILRTLRTPM